MTIRYDDITITVERGQAASNNMITWLTNNNIATTILTYSSEDVRDALHPLSTWFENEPQTCLLYTSPSPRDRQKSRMPSSA